MIPLLRDTTPLTIVVVAPGLWHAPEVVEAARALGHTVYLVGAAQRHSLLHQPLRVIRAAAERVPSLAPPLHYGLGISSRAVAPQPVDLIVCWSSFALGFEFPSSEAPVLIVRGSHHIRRQADLLCDGPKRQKPTSGMIRLEEAEYRHADAITVPTAAIAQDPMWVETGGPPPFVAPYGFPAPQPLVAPRRGGRAELIFGGALSYRKGADRLVEALRARPFNVGAFSIFGSVGVSADEMPTWWTLAGLQSRASWLRALQRSDILLLPSREEGMARVGLEALAAGVPVIATPEAGLGTWLEQGAGIELDGDSWPTALPDAIDLVMSQREGYRDRAQQIASSWTWKDHVLCLLHGGENSVG